MSQEYDEAQMGEEGGMPGPGAPTPLSALEVSFCRSAIAITADAEACRELLA
jgi:hypothetical protein